MLSTGNFEVNSKDENVCICTFVLCFVEILLCKQIGSTEKLFALSLECQQSEVIDPKFQ